MDNYGVFAYTKLSNLNHDVKLLQHSETAYMVVVNGAGRNALVPPSSEEFPHIAYLPSVEKVSVFVKAECC